MLLASSSLWQDELPPTPPPRATVWPGKRWSEEDVPLAIADLNDMAAPLFALPANAAGLAQLIIEEIQEIIELGVIGRRATYIFPYTGLALDSFLVATATVPGAVIGEPVILRQPDPDGIVELLFYVGRVEATGLVNIYGLPSGIIPFPEMYLIPSGTIIEIMVLPNSYR